MGGGELENIPWRESFTLGDGIMSDGAVGPVAFEGLTKGSSAFPSWQKAPHATLSVSIFVVSSSDSYSDLVDVSIEASAEFNGGFGSGGGGLEASYLSSTCADTSSVHLTVNSSYLGDVRAFPEGTQLKLSEAAKEKLRSEGPTAFEKAYGRYYIHGMKRGAWYHGVTSIKARDAKHKTDIKAALNFTYKGAGASADVKARVGKAIENASTGTETTSTEAASGWTAGVDFGGQTVAEMITKANSLATNTAGSPILAILKPYSAVADYAEALDSSIIVDLGKTARGELRSELINLDYLEKAMDNMLDDGSPWNMLNDGSVRGALPLIHVPPAPLPPPPPPAMDNMLDDGSVSRPMKQAIRDLKKPLVAARIGLEETDWGDYANVYSFNSWLTSGRQVDSNMWEPLFAADWIGEKWDELSDSFGAPSGDTAVVGKPSGNRFTYPFDHGVHERISYIKITGGSQAIHGITVKYADGGVESLLDIGDQSRALIGPQYFAGGILECAFAPGDGITEMTVWVDPGPTGGIVRNLSLVTARGAVIGPSKATAANVAGVPTTVRVPPGAVACGLFGSWAWLPGYGAVDNTSNAVIVPESLGLHYQARAMPPLAAPVATPGTPPSVRPSSPVIA
ncbi:hypothetical protein JKP88DRAFT_255267 [Tribonema minus]|uniref:MACPF domain-containing protein n=1 Tax=Tribonema minus TaxID=303371 RepID=A0A835Z371_9STRA|nr:hypothetical protein JKP88DRAFT_255267 [Tribonema minus]